MSDNREQFIASQQKYLDGRFGIYEEQSKCESPIESMFYRAFIMCARFDEIHALVNCQQAIGEYRVDFHISAFRMCWTCALKFERSVIVECDGHQFHEKTKEQVSRDKKRDRALQQAGYTVLRFSGSDIWRDVFACADEVSGWLFEQIDSRLGEHWNTVHGVKSE